MISVKTSGRMILIRALYFCLLWVTSIHSAYASTNSDACADATSLELNGSFRSYGDPDFDFFDVDVPARGYLVVQVVTPLESTAPKVALLGEDCRPGSPAVKRSTIVDTFATGFVLEVHEPGTHRFGVAAGDPRLSLERYKVVTGFVGDTDLPGLPGNKSTEDPDPEVDPIGSRNPKDPDPELDPVGNKSTEVLGWDADLLGKWLCHSITMDDHSDIFPCASTLIPGTASRGELANSWNDDRDVFTFVLTEWQTVEIEGRGESLTLGALFDSHGHLLRVDGERSETGFRVGTTLAPGRYFVAVEGADAAQGEYVLSLTPLIRQMPE